jgi:hypothetical protein
MAATVSTLTRVLVLSIHVGLTLISLFLNDLLCPGLDLIGSCTCTFNNVRRRLAQTISWIIHDNDYDNNQHKDDDNSNDFDGQKLN